MRKSRLSSYKQSRLIELFVAGSTARTAASLVNVNKATASYYYHRLRLIISLHLEQEAHEFSSGEIEVDESYFGGARKGKRGRGAAGKIPVSGLLKRGGKVYTKIIQATVIPDSISIVTVGEATMQYSKDCSFFDVGGFEVSFVILSFDGRIQALVGTLCFALYSSFLSTGM